MKAEKKYYVVAKTDANTWAESEIFVTRAPKGAGSVAHPIYGNVPATFFEGRVKAMDKATATAVLEEVNKNGAHMGITDARILTTKQLMRRFATRYHYYERLTSAREPVNRFGKLDIVTCYENFFGSELDWAKANKGLRNKFYEADSDLSSKELQACADKCKSNPAYIVVEQHLYNDYYKFDRFARRYIAR